MEFRENINLRSLWILGYYDFKYFLVVFGKIVYIGILYWVKVKVFYVFYLINCF